MAKKKRTKKYQPKATSNQKSIPTAPLSKSSTKQKLMIGLLVFTMLLFVFGGLIKSFTEKRTNKTNSQITNTRVERPEPQFRKDGELTIIPQVADAVEKQLDIEIVETLAAIQQGMMYRKSMTANRGMLFKMKKEEPQMFWMKNTHIPLDIIFIDSNKKIVSIQANAIPYSEVQLPSRESALYVLEVNADYCRKNVVNVGDTVQF